MTDDFKILCDFLDGLDSEVQGRSFAEPDAEILAMMQRFARGESGEEERVRACVVLREHPEWMRMLAARVRDARRRTQESAAT